MNDCERRVFCFFALFEGEEQKRLKVNYFFAVSSSSGVLENI